MAEAHQAVAFQFAVTDQGIHVHFDGAAVKQALRSFLGLFKYRYWRARNAILQGVFPASPFSLLLILAVVWGVHWSGGDPSWGALAKITALTRSVHKYYQSTLVIFNTILMLVVDNKTIPNL